MKWTIASSSVSGSSHLSNGTPCQDASFYTTTGSGGEWLVVAVSDGAGSASHSDIASKILCKELVQIIAQNDPNFYAEKANLTDVFIECKYILENESKKLNIDVRQMACTALLAIVGPDFSVFGQIGDGAIIYKIEDTYCIAFWPEPIEYANATDFITEQNMDSKINFVKIDKKIKELSMITDGLQRVALDYSAKSPYAPFFKPFFKHLLETNSVSEFEENINAFLNSEKINSRTDDDKTLVLAANF